MGAASDRGTLSGPDRKRIHLVAHSMGALVVREYLAAGKPARLGRVVLLAAPNHGTPLAEPLKWKPLGRDDRSGRGGLLLSDASPIEACRTTADYAPGILMGNRPGWFPYLSPFIKGPDDGVVAVDSGRLEGMADFRVLTTSHTRMPQKCAKRSGKCWHSCRTGGSAQSSHHRSA